MKQTIPFEYNINLNDNISSIQSLKIEHHEEISNNEIDGYFTIEGEYKRDKASTQIERFEQKIPYNTIISDDLEESSIQTKITNYNYEIIDNNEIKINIDYEVNGEESKNKKIEEQLNRFLEKQEIVPIKEETIIEEKEEQKEITTKQDDYITYHIHIIEENDTIESIIKLYETNLEILSKYNDIKTIKTGDKLIIPELIDE